MEIVKLPVEKWHEYKNLRLRALKEDGQAFGASYEENIKYPDEEWKRRLENALKGETNWLLFAQENDKLVGMIGAVVKEEGVATIIAMYVPKEERGKGIAGKLMEEILKELSQKPFVKKARLTVNIKQKPALNLYKKFGFKEVRKFDFKMGDGSLATESEMVKYL